MQAGFKIHRYPPRLSQPTHRHDGPHLSLVLRGAVNEESGGLEGQARAGMFAIRGDGFAHQVRFGACGALIVSLKVSPAQFGSLEAADVGRWRQGSNRLVEAVLASALEPGKPTEFEDCVWDVIAGPPSCREFALPSWLAQARDRLIDESSCISQLAAEAGVHRVHFSRAFASAFGMPPTVYRRRMAGMRALAAAIDGRRAAASAYECGFADQSHMARVLRQVAGTSYKRLRRLRHEVTSVQE